MQPNADCYTQMTAVLQYYFILSTHNLSIATFEMSVNLQVWGADILLLVSQTACFFCAAAIPLETGLEMTMGGPRGA